MLTQRTFVKPFRVRGGVKADRLGEILNEMGFSNSAGNWTEAVVEFVTSDRAVTRPGSTVIYLVVEAERNAGYHAVYTHRWAADVIFVDAQGLQYEVNKRSLARLLYDPD